MGIQQMDEIQNAIDDWITEVFQGNSRSEDTKKNYIRTITRFRAQLQGSGYDLDPDLLKMPRKDGVKLLASEARKFAGHSLRPGKKISEATFLNRLAALSGFYKYAIREEIFSCQINPISRIKRPRNDPYGKASSPNLDMIIYQLQSIDRSSKINYRDWMIIATMITTGCRCAEVAQLRWKHVSLSQGILRDLSDLEDIKLTLTFERVKGGKSSRHELSNFLSMELLKYLGQIYEINPLYLDGNRPLWPSFSGKYCGQALGCRGIGHVIGRRLKINPHKLRHAYARLLRQTGADLEDIRAALGHTSLDITRIYIEAIDDKKPKANKVDELLFGR